MRFLEIEDKYADLKKAKFVVVPVPYEATTSYGQGTKNGPAAILRASQYVENFDEELGYEPVAKFGIHTLGTINLKLLTSNVQTILQKGKIPIVLGGEHSITPLAVKAMAKKFKDLSVLQLDAHADLRDKYKGRKDSHACVMRRVLEICPAVQVGLRSVSREGYQFAKRKKQLEKMHWAGKLESNQKIIDRLSDNVYITIDVDVFDPSVVPATGAPEPGGLGWYKVLNILAEVCKAKNVVGFDVVELSPRKGDIASDFTIAKLIYKLISYISS
ncbi:agmatinase [Candidatus Margulisiibacteriota bacterium]